MKPRSEIVILVIIAIFVGFAVGYTAGRDDGYHKGRDDVCNSPQVPFKTIPLPACATENASLE